MTTTELREHVSDKASVPILLLFSFPSNAATGVCCKRKYIEDIEANGKRKPGIFSFIAFR